MISCAAVSGASEPCTEFSPTDSANSLRMVPGAALAGFVAPIDFAVFDDGVLALEHLHHHRRGAHLGGQFLVERPALVHGIEALRLRLAQLDALGRDHAQPGILDLGDDLAGQIAPGGVGLDDREGAFERHGSKILKGAERLGLLAKRRDRRKTAERCQNFTLPSSKAMRISNAAQPGWRSTASGS